MMAVRGRRISSNEEKQVCESYVNGLTLKEIATFAGISSSSIMAILRRNNISLRNGKRLTPKQEEMVIALYGAGAKIAKIKEDSGVKSEQTIYRILRDAGIKQRKG